VQRDPDLYEGVSEKGTFEGQKQVTLGPSVAARAGIETCIRFLEAYAAAIPSESAKTTDAHLRAQDLSSLTKILAAWPKLSGEFRVACLAMRRSARERLPVRNS